jgi:archaemetzincin
LFNRLATVALDATRSKVISWVALTEADIYSGDSNYVFALQANSPPIALISAARFRSSFWKTAPDRARLQARLEKQLVSSFGQVIGVPRCSDPRCVRAYPSSLDEFDAKGSTYCEECRAQVEKVIGRKLP